MNKKIQFEKGSDNVFKDLDLADAEELFLKAKLGFKVFQIIEKRNLSQTEAAKILGVKQREISRLKQGKFNHYSVKQLMTFLSQLNHGEEQQQEIEPDTNAYIAVMEEIKRRTDVVFALHAQRVRVMYRATQIESMVLQVRMITELVALASLAAHKSIFEENKKKFEKHWHPKEILKDVESLNPNFYPLPIVEEPPKDARVKKNLVEMKTGFMKRDELIKVHRECGKRLHAQNPFGKDVDYDYYEKMIPKWMERIKNLLNCHQIKLLNADRFYLVHMKEDRDDKVHMYTFEQVKALDALEPDKHSDCA